jgi:hypothetical protein
MMNLSHPNLTAMIKRTFNDGLKRKLFLYSPTLLLIPLLFTIGLKILIYFGIRIPEKINFLDAFVILTLIAAVIVIMFFIIFSIPVVRAKTVSFVKSKLSNIMNLLAIMETDIGDCLIQMEEDLRDSFALNSGLIISGNGEKKEYEKIVLTPLIMDFGLKEYSEENVSFEPRLGPISLNEKIKSKHPYKVRWKPIVAQVEDLCIGIRDYYVHRDKYIEGQPLPLFQIIPFMGINTKNYSMKDHSEGGGVSMKLEHILEDNFGEFKNDATPQQRRHSIDAIEWEKFNGDIESIGSHFFLGIKVYPPLGFDPWPDEGLEREKVCYLYQFCIDNNIPITAHCSPGGFLVKNEYKDFSSPYKWESVLKKYGKLRLNLAHFGGVEKSDWRKKIANMILEIDPKSGQYLYENFYTDISYQGVDNESYIKLQRFLDDYDSAKRRRLIERIIFGTDFMINLQDINAYSAYLDYFFQTKALTLEEKDMLCNKNAERFLFLS